MKPGRSSFLQLKKLSEKYRAASSATEKRQNEIAKSSSRTERLQDWLSPKPEAIQLFAGEKELFRKGLILVTDTRLSYIDPFDRMLKTYMFEHMISVHKQFYRATVFNQRLCKGLLILSVLIFLIILTIDLLDSASSGFFLVYVPLFASIAVGLKAWNDMKPWYVVHWRMRDHTYGEITQMPLLRERLKGDTKREEFMNDLANAMNEALSGKTWWPTQNNDEKNQETNNVVTPPSSDRKQPSNNSLEPDSHSNSSGKTPAHLTLVTDNYQ